MADSSRQKKQGSGLGSPQVAEGGPLPVSRMQQLLASLGVEDAEPRVLNQLIDYVYRHVTDVLLDAETYSTHAGNPAGQVDLDNVMLAVQARSAFIFAQPPAQDEVSTLTNLINSKALPHFPVQRVGLLLPENDKECLTTQNYTVNT